METAAGPKECRNEPKRDRMRILPMMPAAFLLLGAADLPATGPVPEPAPRTDAAPVPEEKTGKPAPDPVPPAPGETALAACEAGLAELGVTFERRDPVDGAGNCGLPATYSVTRIAPGVRLEPETQMTCATARWVAEVVAPAARVFGEEVRLTSLRHASTYVCRNRNGQPDAKISEHALGRAIDIATFEFEGHAPLAVMPQQRRGSAEMAFQRAVRAGACLHFTTVLGPGADDFHDDHIHLDTAQRRGGYRLCQ